MIIFQTLNNFASSKKKLCIGEKNFRNKNVSKHVLRLMAQKSVVFKQKIPVSVTVCECVCVRACVCVCVLWRGEMLCEPQVLCTRVSDCTRRTD